MTTPTDAAPAPRTVHPPRHPLATFASGFLMGSADVVPGVSGGTIALVLGIYEQLVHEIHEGASALGTALRGDLTGAWQRARGIAWGFLLPLLAGILAAVLALASLIEHLLSTQPVAMSAAFFGLVLGSVVVAVTELDRPAPSHLVIGGAVGIATFVLLGLRSGKVDDPTLLVFLAAGALAICAMILPGISGSFILLLIGMYDNVIGAVKDREIVIAAVFAVGAVAGLASFSTLLNRLLQRHHDVVLAALIGLMAGSLRVLWPWPAGADGVGDTRLGAPVAGDVPLALLLAVLGLVAVAGITWLGRIVTDRAHARAAAAREQGAAPRQA